MGIDGEVDQGALLAVTHRGPGGIGPLPSLSMGYPDGCVPSTG